MKNIYGSFNIKKEFKIYKTIGKRSKYKIRNYIQWRKHILKYACDNDEYNINFYHYLIREIREVKCHIKWINIFCIPYELAFLAFSLTLFYDEKNIIVFLLLIIVITNLVAFSYLIDKGMKKISFLTDVCDILFTNYDVNRLINIEGNKD